MITVLYIIGVILLMVFGPALGISAAGYLIQKFKFGNSFKEVYAWKKEQARLEKEHADV